MILYIQNPKDATKKNYQINEFGKTAGYKINIRNLMSFYTLTKNYQKEMLGKQSHLQLYHKE